MQERIEKYKVDLKRKLFIKYGNNLHIEYINTLAAKRVSLDYENLFIVPQIFQKPERPNYLEFEFIEGLGPLYSISNSNINKKLLFKKAGIALAHIHKHGELNENHRVSFNYGFPIKGPLCFIHGDFNLNNVQYKNDDLVILDWQLSPLFQKPANYGSAFHDIVWFIRFLFMNSSIIDIKNSLLADIFLENYLKYNPIDINELKAFAFSFENTIQNLNSPESRKASIKKSVLKIFYKNYWQNK